MANLGYRLVRLLSFTLLLAVIHAAPGLAQGLTGSWTINAMTVVDPKLDVAQLDCTWSGIWVLTDSGGTVTGTVTLNLDSGDRGCPNPMTSTLSAKNNMGSIEGTIGGPNDNLGTVSFKGTVVGSNLKAVQAATTTSGTFAVTNGSSAGNAGTFTGTLAPVMPTMPEIGLVALLLLLFAGGSFFLLRRQRA